MSITYIVKAVQVGGLSGGRCEHFDSVVQSTSGQHWDVGVGLQTIHLKDPVHTQLHACRMTFYTIDLQHGKGILLLGQEITMESWSCI